MTNFNNDKIICLAHQIQNKNGILALHD